MKRRDLLQAFALATAATVLGRRAIGAANGLRVLMLGGTGFIGPHTIEALRRVGAKVEERDDGLTITPGPLHGAVVQTYNDHRMAMSLALVGLKIPGMVIDNPACVAKTYPGFFEDLERLR